jgi:hypothetical protein
MADRYPLPSVSRLLGGLILAGSLPGALVALLALPGGSFSNALGFGTFLGVFYGVGPALLLGLPAIYVLRGVIGPSLKASVVVGVIIASAPVVLAALTIGLGLGVALLAAIPLGGIGGAIFWLVALRGLNPLRPDDASPSTLVH